VLTEFSDFTSTAKYLKYDFKMGETSGEAQWWVERPDIAAQWHPTGNAPVRADQVPRFSDKKFLWQCESFADHYWSTTIPNRLKGGGCTVCSNRSVIVGVNDLATSHPLLASEYWSGNTTPATQVASGSAIMATWICRRDSSHIWKTRVVTRTLAVNKNPEAGCPFCAGKVLVKGQNDLATLFPRIAKQWHPTLNEGKLPSEFMAGVATKVWWICSKDPRHFWEATINSRTGQKTACPICSNTSVISGINDLVTLRPDLALEWHPSLNLPLRPELITAGASKQVYWRCLKDPSHIWKTTCNKRNVRGDGCPICPRQPNITVKVSFADAYPQLVWSWDRGRNLELSPADISQASGKRRFWVCEKNHSYLMSPNDRRKNGCPVCSGKRVVAGINDLQSQRPDLANEWDTSSNVKKPSEVLATTPARYNWVCKNNRLHMWRTSCAERVSRNSGCPYCANKKVLAGDNDLATKNPTLAAECSPNSVLLPFQVTERSDKILAWICVNDPTHEYSMSPLNRSNGGACPTCARGGFDQNKPGYFYYISSQSLNARKIGIANVDSGRLETFRRRGWSVIRQWRVDEGDVANTLETLALRWLRKDHRLPVYLGKEDMPRTEGNTETFELGIDPSDLEIISWVESNLALLRIQRNTSGHVVAPRAKKTKSTS
jgi:hypothetical protein